MEHTTFAEVNKRPQLERLVSLLESCDEIAVDLEVSNLLIAQALENLDQSFP